MAGLAAVISIEFPLSNVVLDTVAADQPDSNCPAACPAAASSTPLCRNELRLPLVPFTVNTSPEPVSNVMFAAAEAAVVTTPAATIVVTAVTAHSSGARQPRPSFDGRVRRPG